MLELELRQKNFYVDRGVARRRKVAGLKERIELLEDQIADLERERDLEKMMRVHAQRGLVSYMREHGLGERIGYDPDRDPDIVEFMAGQSQAALARPAAIMQRQLRRERREAERKPRRRRVHR